MYIYHPLSPDVLIPIFDMVVKCAEKVVEIKSRFESKRKETKNP